MHFGNLQAHDGLRLLDAFLADKSYIEGWVWSLTQENSSGRIHRYYPTQADTAVFERMGQAPSAEFENALRWYKHIASFIAVEKQRYSCAAHWLDSYVNLADVDSNRNIHPANDSKVRTNPIRHWRRNPK